MSIVKKWSLLHPRLGTITGRLIDQEHFDGTKVGAPVVHFRSIPYATIPARFKQSELLSTIPDGYDGRMKGDFTEYGYACPQIPQSADAVSGNFPGEKSREYDEFACLNLTISALPNNSEGQMAKGLPVMVYVHGGALEEGAGHISHMHDFTKFVDLARQHGSGSCQHRLQAELVQVSCLSRPDRRSRGGRSPWDETCAGVQLRPARPTECLCLDQTEY